MAHHPYSIAFGHHHDRATTLAALHAADFTYCPRVNGYIPPEQLTADEQHRLILTTINTLDARRVPVVHRHHPYPATAEAPECIHQPVLATQPASTPRPTPRIPASRTLRRVLARLVFPHPHRSRVDDGPRQRPPDVPNTVRHRGAPHS